MDTQTIQLGHDILLAILDVVLPAVIAYGFNMYKKHLDKTHNYQKEKDIAEKVNELIKLAVVIAEKAGAVDKLTGSQKFNKAVKFVQDSLRNLGITDYDIKQIEAKIETEWAKNKSELEDIYGDEKPVEEAPKEESEQVDAKGTSFADDVDKDGNIK
mgnify:FL=1